MSERILPSLPGTPSGVPTNKSQTDTALTTTSQTDVSEPSFKNQAAPDSPLSATPDAAGSATAAMPHTAPVMRNASVQGESDATPTITAAPATTALSIAALTEAASAGDADAQFELGKRFYQGIDVPQNYAEALSLYTRAAEQGHIKAQNNLGIHYLKSEGVENNEALAFHWFFKAAQQGSDRSQYNLGAMYEYGVGVEQDDVLAFNWYQKAAAQAFPMAQYQVGMMYKIGQGVQQDHAMAHLCFSQAAHQGFAEAQYELAQDYEYGFSPGSVKKDHAQAFSWYQKAADQGYPKAQSKLGDMYEWGVATPRDYAKAASWYRKAADQGDLWGQSALAQMYKKGLGVTQNLTTAVSWFSKAAEQGDKYSQDQLSKAYKDGTGVTKDLKLAAYWQLKSNLKEEGDSVEGARLDISLSGGLIEFIIQHLKESREFQAVTEFNFASNKFSDDEFAGFNKLIRANLPIQSLKISSYERISDSNARLLLEALEFNTNLTNFKMDSFYIGNHFEQEIAALLERNVGIAELRQYVNKHPLVETAGFPLDLVTILIDKMIVSSLKGGQTKEATKVAIDAFMLSASIKPLQDDAKI